MISPAYARARRTLVAGLQALAPFREAVAVIGAQGVYLQERVDIGQPFTMDADIVLDPRRIDLESGPSIAESLEQAGFVRDVGNGRVGIWLNREAGIFDLAVPEAVGGPGRRGARLGIHGDRTAHKVRGIEACIERTREVDVQTFDGKTSVRARVAAPEALLVAKLHKLHDRVTGSQRLEPKDALDVLRLLLGHPEQEMAEGLYELLRSEIAGQVTLEALEHLERLFGATGATGYELIRTAPNLFQGEVEQYVSQAVERVGALTRALGRGL